jgi:hypothetical protein
MSWFKHKPPKHPPPPKVHLHPHHTSPLAEKHLQEQKDLVRGKIPAKKKNDK